jgi:glycerol-3-phosphate dehydrogenase
MIPTHSVAVVGGGINGVMTAWLLAQRRYQVTLFERDTLMSATSSASTKLLHGGVRYLEHGAFRLVHESLRERTWWVEHAPQWAQPIRLLLPIVEGEGRPRWVVGAGLTLYDMLAGTHTFGRHHWHSPDDVRALVPQLRTDTIAGAYSYFDVQMHDHELGLWAAARVRELGVIIREHQRVDRVTPAGELSVNGKTERYDAVVNVAGPWAEQLARASQIRTRHTLDLVRGSHLVLRGHLDAGVVIQVPGEQRICFALPYDGQILLGTTEIRQKIGDPIVCSAEEQHYLLDVYNAAFTDTRSRADVVTSFAGLRPLLRSSSDPSRASREYAIERAGRVVTVFGGKWTTSRVLAMKVVKAVQKVL